MRLTHTFTASGARFLPKELVEMLLSFPKDAVVHVTADSDRKRTTKQQAAIEVWCDMVASELNAHGIERYNMLNGKHAKSRWSQATVKDGMWREMQTHLFPKKTSTTQLTTAEVDQVFEPLYRYLLEHHQIDVPFPQNETVAEWRKERHRKFY